MSPGPSLHSYVDEELLRAPMILNIVVDAVLAQWRLRPPARGRLDGDPVRLVMLHRNELVSTALARLREAAQAELQQIGDRPPRDSPSLAAAPPGNELALIDEDDVEVDIEIARCIQAVKLQAEAELRTLQTYTSALVGDLNVSRDNNPFGPDRFARALGAGVLVLPLARPALAAFLREAATPMAKALESGYQAAWQRLADQGVTPAAHRTIVESYRSTVWGSLGGHVRRPEDPAPMPSGSTSLFGTPTPSHVASARSVGGIAKHERLASTASRTPPSPSVLDAPRPSPHLELIDLLNRLFTTIRRDFGLLADTSALLQPLQNAALQLAHDDPSLLDSYEHPLWRFMDHVVHDMQTGAQAQRLRLAGLVRNLLVHLSGNDTGETQGFGWALERVLSARRHALAQATSAAAPAIERLQRLVRSDSAAMSSDMPLDIGSLDTVPAALITEPAASRTDLGTLTSDGLEPGLQIRCYLQGDWRVLVALWQDDGHEVALLCEPASDRLWALHQGALARLAAEGLAQPLIVRSLVRRATDRLLRGL